MFSRLLCIFLHVKKYICCSCVDFLSCHFSCSFSSFSVTDLTQACHSKHFITNRLSFKVKKEILLHVCIAKSLNNWILTNIFEIIFPSFSEKKRKVSYSGLHIFLFGIFFVGNPVHPSSFQLTFAVD